jgi:hypothetical protein
VKHVEELYEAAKPPLVTTSADASKLTPTIRIVAMGNGSTPEAALQNAIDSALLDAVTSEVNVFDWKQNRLSYLKVIRNDGTGLVKAWQELSCVSNSRFLGSAFRSQAVVDVDRDVLLERLQQVRRAVKRPLAF